MNPGVHSLMIIRVKNSFFVLLMKKKKSKRTPYGWGGASETGGEVWTACITAIAALSAGRNVHARVSSDHPSI